MTTTDGALSALTPRQERFVREYLRTGNAKRSALLAGYSARSAKQVGSALLRHHAVKQAIQARPSEADLPIPELSPEWALRRLVEETGDPNPRVRLDAKKAVAQAVGLFSAAKDKTAASCTVCSRFSATAALADDELQLAVAGTSRESLVRMTPSEFDRWAAALREEAESTITAAGRLRLGQTTPPSP